MSQQEKAHFGLQIKMMLRILLKGDLNNSQQVHSYF